MCKIEGRGSGRSFFECKGRKTVKCLHVQVDKLKQMVVMMTGQGENEESRGGENKENRGGENKENRGGENKENRGGENKENRGGENKENRGGENKESRGGENKESIGNVRETVGKKEGGRVWNVLAGNRRGIVRW